MARPYMPFYTGDYLRDTRHLRAAEHGAYMLLLLQYWDSGKPLPNDPAYLAAIACMSPDEWAHISARICAFFVLCDGVLHHKRVDLELDKYESRLKQKSEAGKASVAKRVAYRNNFPNSEESTEAQTQRPINDRCDSVATESQHNGSGSGSGSSFVLFNENSTEAQPQRPLLCRPNFTQSQVDDIYAAYPRRKNPIRAKEAIRKALMRIAGGEQIPSIAAPITDPFSVLLELTQKYAAAEMQSGKERQYIKYPERWFNYGGYLENPNEWQSDAATRRASGPGATPRQHQPAGQYPESTPNWVRRASAGRVGS